MTPKEWAEWARNELPTWVIAHDPAGRRWSARSPTFDLDGFVVVADTAPRLVGRVRVFVKILALAANRHGRTPIPQVIAGLHLEGAPVPRQELEEAAAPAPEVFEVVHDAPPAPEAAPVAGMALCPDCHTPSVSQDGACSICHACGRAVGGCSA